MPKHGTQLSMSASQKVFSTVVDSYVTSIYKPRSQFVPRFPRMITAVARGFPLERLKADTNNSQKECACACVWGVAVGIICVMCWRFVGGEGGCTHDL